MSTNDLPSWGYFKLYFGNQGERADAFLEALCRRMMANEHVQKWFFLRYVDESGFHVRLRFLPKQGMQARATQVVRRDCGDMLDRMYEFLLSTYRPMVTLPDHIVVDVQVPQVDARLRIVTDTYVPEADKYGTPAAIAIAESVFQLSSELAGRILSDETADRYSRKTIAPWLMHEPNAAFPAHRYDDYWRQYGLYWLGGDTPAARDWRGRFRRKAEELRDAGYAVLAPEAALPPEAADVVRRWRAGLVELANAYKMLGDGSDAKPDVLSLNFAHLMMNRLGIATLEESYLATLLEASSEAPVDDAA